MLSGRSPQPSSRKPGKNCWDLPGLLICFLLQVVFFLVPVRGLSPVGISTFPQIVFHVEGLHGDPQFDQACGLVMGLEKLYGEGRYKLCQVKHPQPGRVDVWRRLALVFLRKAGERAVDKPSRTLICSISGPREASRVREGIGQGASRSASHLEGAEGDCGRDGRVVIGGLEDLLEFVRSNVLAGPRPFSFAYHEGALRIKAAAGDGVAGGIDDKTLGGERNVGKTGDGRRVSNVLGETLSEVSSTKSSGEERFFDYDIVVIGGGSGGLACAKEAATLGAKVACLDMVKPSPMGSTWGLGGTCVNVGCIPKKLMHQAALIGGLIKDADNFGWSTAATLTKGEEHEWSRMVTSVQNHIKGLNFKYRLDLRSNNVEYINALGTFEDQHTVVTKDKNGKERRLTCKKVVLAVGGRPKPLLCEGGELAISSDDLFSMKTPPGRTLVIGASYVALECAGFLTGLGFDTSVMVRSVLLRGFDQEMSERIGAFMASEGTHFIRPAVPERILKTASGRLRVGWKGDDGTYQEEEFDTVFAATGRDADVSKLGLEKIGVATGKGGKIVCCNEETSVEGIFAIGDVVEGVPELTPAAIQAGKLLARRLFGGSVEAMDYTNICTTVFTPLEYGCCGLSEEEAVEKFGEENVEIYHSAFTPLEWQLNPERVQNACYVKAICDLNDRKRVVGLHFLGPNAGEVTQGFGLGIRLGMTYNDLCQLVGIHPTLGEELTYLHITKGSGDAFERKGC